MAWMTGLIAFAVTLHLHGARSLECYDCSEVAHVADCKSIVKCPAGSSCQSTFKSNRYTLGCTVEALCPTNTSTVNPNGGSGTIVGRSATPAVQDGCSQCCNYNNCNRQLCQSDDALCHGSGTLDCVSTAALLNICSDTDHAQKVCKKFCGLCNLVDGNWSPWATWSSCSVTCGNGAEMRTRVCTHPSPANGGRDCTGLSHQTRACAKDMCPVNGGWSHWLVWSQCTVSCGVGLRRRDRSCSNPAPSNTGAQCVGESRDYETCVPGSCQDGGWSDWGGWGTCSKSCDGGIHTRSRTCTNPSPSFLGKACTGDSIKVQQCSMTACANGRWASWGNWGGCSQTCDHGIQKRSRSCTNPPPSILGKSCAGDTLDVRACFVKSCIDQRIGFSVFQPANTGTSGYIRFTETVSNEGGGYNSSAGHFTCPISGVYYFSLDMIKTWDSIISYAECSIYRNVHLQAYTRSKPSATQFDGVYESSTSFYVRLVAGDIVFLNYCTNASTMARWTMFSGFLIKAD